MRIKKDWAIFIFLLILSLAFAGSILAMKIYQSRRGEIASGVTAPVETPETEELVLPAETGPTCTHYTNEEFGFSLCYPVDWSLPQEEEIAPSQEHLYQITLNPTDRSYMVNIYDQFAPVSLGSFVRDYFKEVEGGVTWSDDVEIRGKEALQFFISRGGGKGIGGVAFGRGTRILTITTPTKIVPSGDPKKLVSESTLTQLAESFEWVE